MCVCVLLCVVVCVVGVFRASPPDPPPDPPPPDRPKFCSFFPLSPPQFLFFSHSLVGLFRGILVVFLKTGTLKCARLGSRVVVWNPGGPTRPGRRGWHTTSRELQTCTLERTCSSNTTKIPLKKIKKNCAGEGKKSAKFWAPTLRDSTTSGPTTSSGFGPPPFGARLPRDRPSPGPPIPWTAHPLDRPSPGPPFPWTALWTAQNVALFFPSPAAKFVLFFPLWVSSR